MPLTAMTTPMFWGHQDAQQTPIKKPLPESRSSDKKARALLRRLRTGGSSKTLVVIPSSNATTTTTPPSTADSNQQLMQPQEPAVAGDEEQQQFRTSTPTPSEAETATTTTTTGATTTPNDSIEELPVLPAYVARPAAHEQPPPYIRGQAAILPPALPGYTPLPLPPVPGATPASNNNDPARDLKQPLGARRSYRDVLRRRMLSTKRLFGSNSSSSGSGAEAATADNESQRGVVLYRDDHDRWMAASELDEIDDIKFMQAKQTGLKGWLKRVWASVKDFMEEHPMLFFIALFVIIVVALCVLI